MHFKPVLTTLFLAGIVSAIPAKRALGTSPDGSCGGTTGYTCQGSGFGNCCSSYGYCGSTDIYCGAGCNAGFGTCSSISSSSTSTSKKLSSASPSASLSTKASSSVSPVPSSSPSSISTDGTCGGANGFTCRGSSFGDCCSLYGYCGSADAYCGTTCQPGFGSCTSSTSSSTTKPSDSGSSSQPASKTSPSSSTASASASGTLTDCLSAKNVPIRLISSPDFAQLAKPYNLRLPFTPTVIIIPTTTQHISDAVVCASKFNVKVQPKSGGHSYASFSSGGQNGSMVIDLEQMQNISVDASGLAIVGSGVRLGNLAQGIYDQGKRALAHGTCPGVGIGGHFTHGGYGYDSRAWGLAMDQIVGLDVVLANGSFVHATTTAYPDIYYALRGAADSFGVVVNFYLQTQSAPTTVVNFSYGIPGMFNSKVTSAKYFSHIQDFARNASVVDRKLGFGMYMDGGGFSISGTYLGTKADFLNKIAPELLRSLPTPSSTSVQALDWISSLINLSGETSLTQPTTGYDKHDNFFAKSLTVPESTPLTTAALQSYFDYMITKGVNPPSPWFSIINLYGGPDSQINTKDVNFAAYNDRDSLWVIQHYAFASGATLPAAAMPFLEGLQNSLTSPMASTSFGAYLNYVDPSLSAATAHQQYYGDALYSKLLGIKKAVDPGNVFWNPQTIGA